MPSTPFVSALHGLAAACSNICTTAGSAASRPQTRCRNSPLQVAQVASKDGALAGRQALKAASPLAPGAVLAAGGAVLVAPTRDGQLCSAALDAGRAMNCQPAAAVADKLTGAQL